MMVEYVGTILFEIDSVSLNSALYKIRANFHKELDMINLALHIPTIFEPVPFTYGFV